MIDHWIYIVSTLMILNTLECRGAKRCISRKYEYDSIVCVCNATYCDEIDAIKPLLELHYVLYTTSKDGERFHKQKGVMKSTRRDNDWFTDFLATASGSVTLDIDRTNKYQTIIGFGGAFTDSTGYNIKKLSKGAQDRLMRSLFGPKGIEFNMGRVPIGGTDFSPAPYAYNMYPEDDVHLSNFSLAKEDFDFKIPFMRQANKLSKSKIFYFGSCWSPPVWMKTNKAYIGASKLYDIYYQTYADYHLKFLQEYAKNGLEFWGITPGNEPSIGYLPTTVNAVGLLPNEMGLWIATNLGPTLRRSNFSHIKIIAVDDLTPFVPLWMEWMQEKSPDLLDYIDGIGTHWYIDEYMPESVHSDPHDLYPDKFILSTESSAGFFSWEKQVRFGDWDRGMKYVKQMILSLRNWYSGWVDWNMALDPSGGPSWVVNSIDAPIIVIGERDEFVKQPIFYALGHFSKFLPRGSVRIDAHLTGDDLHSVAFLRPDNGVAIVFYNPTGRDRTLTVRERERNVKLDIPPHSFNTMVYW